MRGHRRRRRRHCCFESNYTTVSNWFDVMLIQGNRSRYSHRFSEIKSCSAAHYFVLYSDPFESSELRFSKRKKEQNT